MAKKRRSYERSELRPYKSPYGDGFVTPAEYITQILIARELVHNGDTPRPYFWDNPYYAKKFPTYRLRVNSLLELFTAEEILRAFNRPDMKKIWSPSYPNLHKIIREEKLKLAQKANLQPPELPKKQVVQEDIPVERKPRPVGKKTLFGKLNE